MHGSTKSLALEILRAHLPRRWDRGKIPAEGVVGKNWDSLLPMMGVDEVAGSEDYLVYLGKYLGMYVALV